MVWVWGLGRVPPYSGLLFYPNQSQTLILIPDHCHESWFRIRLKQKEVH